MHFRNKSLFSAAILGAAVLAAPSARADVLEVSPIGIEVKGGDATTETLTNHGTTPINAQVRVFKWTNENGVDRLEPTTEVVASPPALKIAPGAQATVRIVRLSKKPVQGEESYRLLVDDIPATSGKPDAMVSFAVRQSIPVFFQAPGIKSNLSWSAKMVGSELQLTAQNSGTLHARLAQLRVVNGVTPTSIAKGLAGYTLAGKTMVWKYKVPNLRPGTQLKVEATTNDGNVASNVQVQ